MIEVALPNLKEKKKTTLTEWVKLKVCLLDGLRNVKTVQALVSPELCTSVILGLPFLMHDSIVTNHAAWTCMDKKCDYDLLNPAVPWPLK
jgi:hypothetical protein